MTHLSELFPAIQQDKDVMRYRNLKSDSWSHEVNHMGTRALIRFVERNGYEETCFGTAYKHCDGPPSRLGADILRHLNQGRTRVVKHLRTGERPPDIVHGMGQLAAYLLGALGRENDDLRLCAEGQGHLHGDAEYTYKLFTRENSEEIWVELYHWSDEVFEGHLCRLPDQDQY